MKKTNFALSALLLVSGLLIGTSINPAHSDVATQGIKIAVVDVPAIVAKSAQVQALKKEQDAKKAELEKWLKTVRADVEKQQTQEGKEKLLKKYDSEFAKKQSANKEAYVKKLSEIDASISATINQVAKEQGYGLVLAKTSVLYGGSDLTNAIAQKVK